QKIDPDVVTDEELKLMALNALMQSDPDRAIPILEKLLQGKSSPKLKDKALFILSQSQSAEAGDILSRIARSSADPDLQRRAVRYLGIIGSNGEKLYEIARSEPNPDLKLTAIRNLGLLGGERSGQMLLTLYQSDSRIEVRRAVINSLFIQGSATTLVSLARQEKDPELKK